MIRYLFLFLTVLFSFAGNTQQTDFPENFIGHWKGELKWYKAGKETPENVPMQLIIKTTATAGEFTWQLRYGADSSDMRPYILKTVDRQKGHWVVDEQNGIILDQYWIGGRLTGMFTVMKSTILNTYRLQNDTLIVEMTGLSAEPLSRTGKGNEESPYVDSYQLKNIQTAILTRQ